MTGTDITLLNTDNFAEMAKAMGMGGDLDSKPSKASTLPRLRVWNSPVMGQVDVKGKMKNMEVIPAGMFRLQLPDDTFIFSSDVNIRVFVQRFMYKRYASNEKIYIKTLMAEDLKGDLKDNTGGFNCGKPAGYVKDYAALPQSMRDLITQTKRVRVLLGEVQLKTPLDMNGEELEDQTHPFIWEIDNRDAFKTMGEPFSQLGRQRRLPVQHWISCSTEEHKLATGASFFLPTQKLDLSTSIELQESDQQRFADFIEWIGNYNQYIITSWNDKKHQAKLSDEDEAIVDDYIEIDED